VIIVYQRWDYPDYTLDFFQGRLGGKNTSTPPEVKWDMTFDEVRAILGPPDKIHETRR